MSGPGWQGRLSLHYSSRAGRTVGIDRHEGPLRVLQPLYPEGPAICHHVLIHPPGGLVGGDELSIELRLDPGTHALVTTPGATRFYRSEGATAQQSARLRLDEHARLEWLPLETIAYPGCRGESVCRAELAPTAELLGWDVLALGLPAAGRPFDAGWFRQHLELPGVWLERGHIAAEDRELLASPAGWAGHDVLATLWFACGGGWEPARREALLELARDVAAAHALVATAGVSSAHPEVIVLRALARGAQTALGLLAAVRAVWRRLAWGLAEETPRIWRT